jgi:hypothetical protein
LAMWFSLQATMCPSSGDTTIFMWHLVLVILYGWLSGMQGGMNTRQSSVQNNKYQVSHRYSYFSWWWAIQLFLLMMGTVAQNTCRKETKIQGKIVHHVGFIYKIIQGRVVNET